MAKQKVSTSATTTAKESTRQYIYYGLGAIVLIIGFFHSFALRWVSDDSFITFRYVKHFVEGNGIVYNIGERVEGYTHFLWLLILSAVKFVGLDPVSMSMTLGLACFLGLLVLYILISKKITPPGVIIFPITAALLAMNYDMDIWATGGLETSLYTLLISAAFYLWFFTSLPHQRKVVLTGLILILTTLTRPDGALFTIISAILLLLQERRSGKPIAKAFTSIVLLLLPSILIGIPYLIWKYSYYGDIFPTTFYAKSADQSYFGQGLFYIILFFKAYWSAAAALIAWVVLRFFLKKLPSDSRGSLGSPTITAFVAIVVYCIGYVAVVGGDFMFARFMIPILPFMYFLLESILVSIEWKPPVFSIIVPAALMCLVLVEGKIIRSQVLFHFDQSTGKMEGNWGNDDNPGETRGIADERWVYMRERFTIGGESKASIEVYSDIGKFLEPFFRGLPVTIAVSGAQNSIAYYADFNRVVNVFGLTDKHIAMQAVTKRGRIGHEKKASNEYLADAGVHYYLYNIREEPPKPLAWDMAVFGLTPFNLFLSARVVNYDKAITTELEKRFAAAGVPISLQHYDEVLQNYLTNIMPTLTLAQAEENYTRFKSLYFRNHPDPSAEQKMKDYIAQKKQTP